MRLHHLEVTAFGPFADTVTVDFDALSGAGLFLLCGPTGAGKTSVLDAVCFAVYGDVPGDRSSAKRLRCDVAPAGRAPRVRLELTLAGRRFRLTRSPQWSRPKKRGTGTTTEQASVLVEERVAGSWTALSTRLDEAGHLLTGLVGMTMPQFCQVAMLPQGRFQAFLRASSQDRHKLLQQLFSTQRFEDVETWLRDRSRVLHRESQAHLRTVSDVTSRLLESAEAALPESALPESALPESALPESALPESALPESALADTVADLADAAGSGELAAFAAALTEEAATRAVATADASAEATTVEDDLRTRLDEARVLAHLLDRAAGAEAELARLTADATIHEERRTLLATARRAAPVLPLHRLATAAQTEAERARRDAGRAAGEAAPALTRFAADEFAADRFAADEFAADRLGGALADARDLLADAERLVPRQAGRVALATAVATGESAVEDLAAACARLEAEAAALPERLSSLRSAVADGRTARAEAVAQREREALLVGRLEAHDRAERLDAELAETRARLDLVVGECLALKETWLDLREARLVGMAAEIATGLAVGDSCPVCGSEEHPHKATAAPGAPDATAEKAARSRLDDAELTRTALEAKSHDLSTLHAQASALAGDAPAAEVAHDLIALRELLGRLDARAEALPADEAALARTEMAAAGIQADRLATETGLASTQARLEADRATLATVVAEVDAALDAAGAETVDELVGSTRAAVRLLERVATAVDAATAAAAEADRATAALDNCLAECGFGDIDEALAGVLPADETASLEREVAARDDALAAARAVLDEPAVAAARGRERPDLAGLTSSLAEAAERRAAAEVAARTSASRASRVAALVTELQGALAAWAPVRAAHAVASELASFVEGKSIDNELRMRLSAYVLAWRLTQVVAAANERLLQMADQRYTLEHTGRRGAGESRGGLSLLVRDAWSGEARDPATLSGGETFVVSLALALGLADVVSHEAGGADLDTLFVDEGFGALDPDTLDDVMDTLDTLREGGRVVGVVSHVAELRSRIPTRLLVTKGRTGSALALEHAAE